MDLVQISGLPKDFSPCPLTEIFSEVRPGVHSIILNCCFQICLPTGETSVGAGSPAIIHGRYIDRRYELKGVPSSAAVSQGRYYVAFFPNGLKIENCWWTELPRVFIARKDEFRNGGIYREMPRHFQM